MRFQSLILAVSLTVPTAALMAQSRDDNRNSTTRSAAQINADDDREIEIFEGKLMSLHAFLAKGDHDNDITRTTATAAGSETYRSRAVLPEPSRTTATSRGSETGNRTTVGTQAGSATTGSDHNLATAQRAGMSGQMNDLDGPMGILVKKEGVLGLGSGEEFYILTFDPANNTSKEAYQRTARFSRTGNLLEQSDRDYVRDPATRSQNQQRTSSAEYRQNTDRPGVDRPLNQDSQARPGSQNAAAAPAVPTTGNLVRITGEKIERDGIEAIIVHSVSPGTRDSGARDEILRDREDRQNRDRSDDR